MIRDVMNDKCTVSPSDSNLKLKMKEMNIENLNQNLRSVI
jgi:hypothetical protein